MQSVGQKLRAARLAQGLTLDQVHSSTRISLPVLEAIEADDVHRINSAFHYRSFVRQLAQFLKLDDTELAGGIAANSEQIPAPLVPGQEHKAHEPKVPALKISGRRSKSRWVRQLTSFAAALFLCTLLYAYWQNAKLHLPAALTKTNEPAKTESAPAATPATDPAKPNPAEPQQETANSVEPRSEQNGFTLKLSATEPAWLSIVADGKVSFRGILERAETKVLQGHQVARVRTGNAGAVEAVFNGKPIGVLGSLGQVRTVVFTKDEYEVLESSPHVSLLQLSPTFELAREIRPRVHDEPVAF